MHSLCHELHDASINMAQDGQVMSEVGQDFVNFDSHPVKLAVAPQAAGLRKQLVEVV